VRLFGSQSIEVERFLGRVLGIADADGAHLAHLAGPWGVRRIEDEGLATSFLSAISVDSSEWGCLGSTQTLR
jgi:hypothetical protein